MGNNAQDFMQEFKSYGEQVKTSMETLQKKGEATEEDVIQLKKAVDNIEMELKFADRQVEKKNRIAGQDVARLWKSQIVAQMDKCSIAEAADKIYGKNAPKFVEEVKNHERELKTLSATGNAGSVLIEEQYYGEILPLLYNKLTFMTLGARKVPMPNGHLNIRKLVEGSTFSYVGESKPANKSTPKFANLKLSGKKGRSKVVFSNDLLRSASPAADQAVRDDLVMQARLGMDFYGLYGTGGEFTPLGIANTSGITKVAGNPAINGDDMYKDMVQPLKKANIPMQSIGWIIPPEVFTILYNETFANGTYKYRGELKEGRFHGYPFVESNQVKTTATRADVFFGDWAQFYIGEQVEMEVRVSEEATYTDENGNLQSAFDNDETVVQLLMIHDFGAVYGKAFSFMTADIS